MSGDDLPPGLLDTFVTEVRDQVRSMNRDLLELEKEPDHPELLRSLFRAAHTVKGAARVVGVRPVESLCHAMEAFFAAVRDGATEVRTEHFPILFATADTLSGCADDVEARRPVDTDVATPLEKVFARLATGGAVPDDVDGWLRPLRERREGVAEGPGDASPGDVAPEPEGETRATPEAGHTSDETGADEPTDGSEPTDEDASQRAGTASTREMRVAVEDVERLFAPLATIRSAAAEFREVVERAEEFLASMDGGFGAGGTALASAEGSSLVRDQFEAVTVAARSAGETVARAADDLGDSVASLRLRPVSDAFDALPRAVRDLAKDQDKSVELAIEGEPVHADRAVIDALRDPLLHLVRNAVDHGIEPPAEREAAGKPRHATVTIRTERHRGRLRVLVHDDGRGLDPEAIRERLGPAAAHMTEDEVVRSLFQGGVSTREDVSEISGRGVGLDLVRDRMESIRGHLEVDWRHGPGTTFSLEFPPSPSTVRVLLVEVDADELAIPLGDIEHLLRVDRADVRSIDGQPVVDLDGPVPLVPLAEVLGPPFKAAPRRDRVLAVVLRGPTGRLAVAVDRLVDELEVVVRPIRGKGVDRGHLFGGALVPGDRVAPVLDGRALVERGLAIQAPGRILTDHPDTRGPSTPAASVLVVDDSLTTRSLEQSVLEGRGYRVVTAADGRDAWRKLQEDVFDLVVSDVEMPKEDGLTLCRRIRSSARFRDLPVILVTALETEAERAAGLDAGASAYLGKSRFDQGEFLDTVAQFIGEAS